MGLSVLSHRRWCRSLIIQVGFFDFSFFETKFKGGGGLNLSHVNGGARSSCTNRRLECATFSGGVAGALKNVASQEKEIAAVKLQFKDGTPYEA
uniref:Uncharacterized protein n=1 Tax=Fagus sylvatica TaxID=28930 RepID=A0A2N9HC10_FAGSY